MSSVKMQGNAGGTGSIILASPNTNNNQTLTLPDATGQVIATDGTGAAVLPRVDSASEGGQINFNRAVDNVANWSIDSYGSTTTPLLRFIDGANVRMVLDSSGNVGIGTNTPQAKIDVRSGSTTFAANILSTGANTYTAASGTSLSNATLQLTGGSASGATTGIRMSQGGSFELYVGGVQESGGAAAFVVQGYNGAAYAERARIDSSGNLLVGCTSLPSASVAGWAANAGAAPGYTISSRGSTSNVGHYAFYNPNGQVGFISTSGSSTIYNTSSDYRLKENIAPMTGALSVVQQLKPCTYTWKADGSDGQGFIAHELQEVVPDCVTGEKDAIDADGNPVYQGIDTSFLVATLTAAIQEQQALITSLTERIAALEAK